MMKNGKWHELYSADLSEALSYGASIQKEAGIIGGVVLLTGNKVSRNKTLYTSNALNEAATRYEGAKMFLDHPKNGDGKVRSVRDLGGTYKNVRIEEGRLLKADLHLLPNQQVRDIVFPIAEAKLEGVGLSIRDRGKGKEDDKGVFLVEGFAPGKGFSIDLVTEASVNENLFESEGGDDDMKIEEIGIKNLEEGNPKLLESIRTEERKKVTEEFGEKLKKGEDAQKMLEQGRKLIALAEAGLPSNVTEKVKKMIESESVTFDVAEGIIKAQKEICEEFKKDAKPDPKVKGHGTVKDENDSGLPSDEELAEAFSR